MNNHFEFGRLEDDIETFVVSCGPCQRTPRTPFEESVLAAQDIFNKKGNLQIKLMMSGGVDSECMAQAFIAAKVPFEAIFMRFHKDLNMFDIETNISFCEKNNIAISFLDLDIEDFFESGKYAIYAEKYECQSPQIAAHLWMLEQVEGLPVMGGNPIAPIWKQDRWFFIGLPGELHSTYFKFFEIAQRPGIPWFFLYSPELVASFFTLPVMQDFILQKITDEKDYTYERKCRSYNEGGFIVQPRQDKFTGFEILKNKYDQLDQKTHGVAFNDRYRAPLEQMFSFPEKYLQFIPKNYFPNSV